MILRHGKRLLFRCDSRSAVFCGKLCRIVPVRQQFLKPDAGGLFPYYLVPVCIPDHQQILLRMGRCRPGNAGSKVGHSGRDRHHRQFRHDPVFQICIQRTAIADDLHRIQLPLTAHDLVGDVSLDGIQCAVFRTGHQPHMGQRRRIPGLAVKGNVSGTWHIAAAL